MTASALPGMAADIDELIRTHPGVTGLYRSGGLVGNAVGAVKNGLDPRHAAGPLSVITGDGEHISVAVTIGVDSDSAADTCRVVHDSISAWLQLRGCHDRTITVTVAHVAA